MLCKNSLLLFGKKYVDLLFINQYRPSSWVDGFINNVRLLISVTNLLLFCTRYVGRGFFYLFFFFSVFLLSFLVICVMLQQVRFHNSSYFSFFHIFLSADFHAGDFWKAPPILIVITSIILMPFIIF